MEDDRRLRIEETVRKCTDLLDGKVTEQQIQSMIDRLIKMKDMQTVMDSLALNVDKLFGNPEQQKKFEKCIDYIASLSDGAYSREDIITQIQENKSKNYTPGNISVEENHELINDTVSQVCEKLNKLGVDYYVVGALSTFIGTQTPLFRYHGDLDFMVAEKDIPKVQEALAGTNYDFQDDRLDNKKRLENGVGHTQGEHEVIANHKENEFHLGFFLFRREQDNSMTVREYFMQENTQGEKVPMVLERHMPKELVDLEYTSETIEYAGTRFRVSTPESVYSKKMFTQHPKDLLDIQALASKIDKSKITEMEKYPTTTKIVEADRENILAQQQEGLQRINSHYQRPVFQERAIANAKLTGSSVENKQKVQSFISRETQELENEQQHKEA